MVLWFNRLAYSLSTFIDWLRWTNEVSDYRCEYCLDTGTSLLVKTIDDRVWTRCYCNATGGATVDEFKEIEKQSIERYKAKQARLLRN